MIEIERRESGLAIVSLCNPPLNLLNQEMRRGLGDFFLAAGKDDGIRAIVLTHGRKAGEKMHFCAGADIKEHALRSDRDVARQHAANGHRMALAIVECGKPTIAAIEGACLGGGFELALACDFRVASDTAMIGLPEVQRGLFPGTGGIRLLSRLAGPAIARRLVYSGEKLSGRQAFEIGLVDRIAPAGEAMAVAVGWGEELAAAPGRAVQAARRLMDADFAQSFRAYLDREIEEYVDSYQTADSVEGREAFLAKREPRWQHS